MQLRKNTKAFKTLLSILDACQERPDRDQLVRLYITRAGQSISDRIYIEGIQADTAILYDLNYSALLSNLRSTGHQLFVSDEVPGLYYLRSGSGTWDETPFEFADIILKRFAGLPELPVTRKKETPQKYNLPTPKEIAAGKSVGKQGAKPQKETKLKIAAPVVKQPSYHLRQPITFTDLDTLVYPQANCNKRNVLDYYDQVSEYLLPWLKDRPLWVRRQSQVSRESILLSAADWPSHGPALPAWLPRETSERSALFCNSREHLFFYLECGFIEFAPSLARSKAPLTPDYLLLSLDSPGADLTPTLEVVRAASAVLEGLKLPSFVKSDGQTGIHVTIPLDGKSDFDTCQSVAVYLAQLIRIKAPQLITLHDSKELTFGRVSLQCELHSECRFIAPYSLVVGATPLIAAPLRWEELEKLEDITPSQVMSRLKQSGDPFANFFKKKVDACDLLELLKKNYSFLF